MKDKGWETWERDTFNEVIPQNDLMEHYVGDECWCKPRKEIVHGGEPNLIIVHNSADGREIIERMLESINNSTDTED